MYQFNDVVSIGNCQINSKFLHTNKRWNDWFNKQTKQKHSKNLYEVRENKMVPRNAEPTVSGQQCKWFSYMNYDEQVCIINYIDKFVAYVPYRWFFYRQRVQHRPILKIQIWFFAFCYTIVLPASDDNSNLFIYLWRKNKKRKETKMKTEK